MANPQTEQGHIRIAFDLWDAWCRVGSSKERVFKAIIRLTWGWSRKTANIRQVEIARLTGITNRSQISKLTAALVDEGMIIKVSQHGRPTEYGPQKDFEQWTVSLGGTSSPAGSTSESGTSSSDGSTDSGGNGSTSKSGNGSTFESGNTPSLDYSKEYSKGNNNHPPIAHAVEETETPRPLARSPDDLPSIFQRLMGGPPSPIQWEEFGALIQGHGPERVRRWLEKAEENPTCRGGRVIGYLRSCGLNANGREARQRVHKRKKNKIDGL